MGLNRHVTPLKRFVKDEQGQDLVEYSLLIALIAVVCAGLVQSAGGGYKNLWTTTASMLANAQSIAAS
jgi:Flp pilus assembly pilin Flp